MARQLDPKEFIRSEEQLNQIYAERGKQLAKNAASQDEMLQTQLEAARTAQTENKDRRKAGALKRELLELEEKAAAQQAIANELIERSSKLQGDQIITLGSEKNLRKSIREAEVEFYKSESGRPKVYADMAKKLQITAMHSQKLQIQEEMMGEMTQERRTQLEGVLDTTDRVQRIQQDVASTAEQNRDALRQALGFESAIVPFAQELRNIENEIALAKMRGNQQDVEKLQLAQQGLKAASDAQQMEDRRLKTTKEILNAMEQQTGAAGQIFSTLKNIVMNPLTLLTGLLAVGLRRYEQMRQEGLQLREEMDRVNKALGGQGVYQEKNLAYAKELQSRFQQSGEGFASSLEGAAELTAALSDQFGSVYNVSGKLVDTAAKLRLGIGLSAEESAKVMDNMMLMSGFSEEAAISQIESTYAMSDMYGLNPAAVFQDIASASAETRSYFGGTAEQVKKAAIEARRMGIEMDDMAKVAKGLLDFESSIEAEMEAQLITGKNINLSKAREMAMNDDALGATQEVLKQMGGIEEYNKMNTYQKNAVAKAAGLEVGELEKMLKGNKMKEGQEKEAEKRKNKEAKLLDQQVKVMNQLHQGMSVMEKIAMRIGNIFLKVFGTDLANLEKDFMAFINSDAFETGLTHFLQTVKSIITTIWDFAKGVVNWFKDSWLGKQIQNLLKMAGGGDMVKGIVNTLMVGWAGKKVIGLFGPFLKGLLPSKITSLFSGAKGLFGFGERGTRSNPMVVTDQSGGAFGDMMGGKGGKGGKPQGFARLFKAFSKGGMKGGGKAISRMAKGSRIGQMGSMLAGGKTASLGGTALGGAGVMAGGAMLLGTAYMAGKGLNEAGTEVSGKKKKSASLGAAGAATGAVAGAAIGSVIPVVGTLLGAGIGALIGYGAGVMAGKLTIFENDVDAARRLNAASADELNIERAKSQRQLTNMLAANQGNEEAINKINADYAALESMTEELSETFGEAKNATEKMTQAAQVDAFLQEGIAANRSMWGDDEEAMIGALGGSADLIEREMEAYAKAAGGKATMEDFFADNKAAKDEYFALLFEKTGVTDAAEQERMMNEAMAGFGDTTFYAGDALDGFGDFMTDSVTAMQADLEIKAQVAEMSQNFQNSLLERKKRELMEDKTMNDKQKAAALKAYQESDAFKEEVLAYEKEKQEELEYANKSFWEKLWDGIKNFPSKIGEWIGSIGTFFKTQFMKFGDTISGWGTTIWNFISAPFKALGDKIATIWKMMKALFIYPFNFKVKWEGITNWPPISARHMGWDGTGWAPGDDVFSPAMEMSDLIKKLMPGYGNRTLTGPEGSIALNNKDTVLAGTDLGITGILETLQSGVKDITVKVQTGAQNLLKDPVGTVTSIMKEGKNDLFSFFTSAKDKVKGIFQPDENEKQETKESKDKLNKMIEEQNMLLKELLVLVSQGRVIEMDGAEVGKAIALATNKA